MNIQHLQATVKKGYEGNKYDLMWYKAFGRYNNANKKVLDMKKDRNFHKVLKFIKHEESISVR